MWIFLLFLAFGSAFPVHASFESNERFAEALRSDLKAMPQFQFLQELAEKHGAKVYLFGGTAASGANFTWRKEDANDHPGKYLPHRLEPRFENLFPPSKDLDVVVDAAPDVIEAIRKEVEARFPRNMPDGTKSAWEFRPLRFDWEGKQALWGNEEFLRQHNDSLSTSLLSLDPKAKEVVLDLAAIKGVTRPGLLESLRKGELHYFFSPEHHRTERFLRGMNPPILSAMRALSKSLEFDLKIRQLEKLKEVVGEFRPSQVQGYPRRWIEKNGVKLFQSSGNLGRSFEVLRDVGLWEQLSQFGSRAQEGSLAWWMAKDPLPAKPLGVEGKTARELGLTTVAHSTRDFKAYQVMSLSPTGRPNVFQSRPDAVGEAAVFGNGFYVAKGEKGAWDNPYTLVYDVHPDAREGIDFAYVHTQKGQDWYKFLNESALRRRESFSAIPLATQVRALLGLTKDEGNLPPQEYFSEMRGSIINEVRALPPAERFELEKILVESFSSSSSKVLALANDLGGFSSAGQSYIVERLIKDAAEGKWHSRITGLLPPYVTAAAVTKEQQEKITRILTGQERAGWYTRVAAFADHLRPELRKQVRDYLETTLFPSTFEHNRLYQATSQILDFVSYLELDPALLQRLEGALWRLGAIDSHNLEQWKELVATNRGSALDEALGERLPSTLSRYSVSYPEDLRKKIYSVPQLRASFEEQVQSQLHTMLRNRRVNESVVALLQKAGSEGTFGLSNVCMLAM